MTAQPTTTEPDRRTAPAGVWVWMSGLGTALIVLPAFVSPGLLDVFESLEIDLPILTRWALELSSFLGSLLGVMVISATFIVTAAPALVWKSRHWHRLYMAGGIAFLLITTALAVHTQWVAGNLRSKLEVHQPTPR